jgi:hypothetical protein
MLPPNRRTSTFRSLTITTRSFRLAALLALVAVAVTALAANSSSASSLGRSLFARATSIVTPAAVNAAHSEHAL